MVTVINDGEDCRWHCGRGHTLVSSLSSGSTVPCSVTPSPVLTLGLAAGLRSLQRCCRFTVTFAGFSSGFTQQFSLKLGK